MAKLLSLIFLISASTGFAAPSQIRIAIGNSQIDFNPISMPNQNTLFVTRQIHCQLTRLVEGEVRGDAASDFVFDHSNRQLVYTLKPNLTFADGSPVLAQDVEATLLYYQKERPYIRNVFSWIEKVESSNASRQIRITYSRNPNSLLQMLSYALFPILRKKDIQKGKEADWQKPIGCGDYKITTRSSGMLHLASRQNPDRKIVFTQIADNELSAKAADQYDLISIPVRGSVKKELREVKVHDPYQIFVGINTSLPQWKDKGKRCQALAGFETAEVLKAYGDTAIGADDFYPRGTFGYDAKPKFNQILNEKVPSGPPGKSQPGCLAMLRVSVPKSIGPKYLNHNFLKGLELKTILDAAHFKDEFAKSNCDFMVIGLKANTLDGYEFQLLFTEPKTNFMNYVDPELKTLIADGQNAPDKRSKFTQYRRISEKIAETCTIRPLVTIPYKTVLVRNSLSLTGLGDVPLNDLLLKW